MLTFLNFRWKRFMMSLKLATYATSECLPAGHGNVCVFLCVQIAVLNVLSLSCSVQAMQSKSTPLLIYILG